MYRSGRTVRRPKPVGTSTMMLFSLPSISTWALRETDPWETNDESHLPICSHFSLRCQRSTYLRIESTRTRRNSSEYVSRPVGRLSWKYPQICKSYLTKNKWLGSSDRLGS